MTDSAQIGVVLVVAARTEYHHVSAVCSIAQELECLIQIRAAPHQSEPCPGLHSHVGSLAGPDVCLGRLLAPRRMCACQEQSEREEEAQAAHLLILSRLRRP